MALPMSTLLKRGKACFRLTSRAQLSRNQADHPNIVNGQGPFQPHSKGARYNTQHQVTTYLTDRPETCLSERMFYFHRETVQLLDKSHYLGVLPPFSVTLVLWEIVFAKDVTDLFDMLHPPNLMYFNIFPSLPLNPTHDYEHLKQKRNEIQAKGYEGIVAPSSRCTAGGSMHVLFKDQSKNVLTIEPHFVEFRLVNDSRKPFVNHAHEMLDFTQGQIKVDPATASRSLAKYTAWTNMKFHH